MYGHIKGLRHVLVACLFAVPMLVASQAGAADFRLHGQGGWAFSALDTTPETLLDDTNVTVLLNAIRTDDGPLYGGAFWVDDLIGKNWSIGIEYLRADLKPELRFNANIVGIDVPFDIPVDATLSTFFLNVAWRRYEGPWHPYGGIGLGGGTIRFDFGDGIGEEKQIQAGVQGFAGIDYDISERWYIGASTRLYYVDANIIGEDIRFLEVGLLGNVGFRF